MGTIGSISRSRIEPVRGPIRHGHLGAVSEPVVYSMQGTLRNWYGAGPVEPETVLKLDHIVAAVGA
jgi:hypothetical protein